jgi:hypothetical protein
MSKELTVIVEGTKANGKPICVNYEMSARELMTHIKQIIKSVAKTGVVYEIEDRQNPFNAIAVDHVQIFRTEDAEPADDEFDDGDDDDKF